MFNIIAGPSEKFLLKHRLLNVVTFCGIIIAGLMFFSDLSIGLGSKFYCFPLIGIVLFMSFAMRRYHDQYRKITLLNRSLEKSNTVLKTRNDELESALTEFKPLMSRLPICCTCKKIRDSKDQWNHIESYFHKQLGIRCTHVICPDCFDNIFSETNSSN